MATTCKHYTAPYENTSPSNDEINRFRLWKCESCGKWHSLIGNV